MYIFRFLDHLRDAMIFNNAHEGRKLSARAGQLFRAGLGAAREGGGVSRYRIKMSRMDKEIMCPSLAIPPTTLHHPWLRVWKWKGSGNRRDKFKVDIEFLLSSSLNNMH